MIKYILLALTAIVLLSGCHRHNVSLHVPIVKHKNIHSNYHYKHSHKYKHHNKRYHHNRYHYYRH